MILIPAVLYLNWELLAPYVAKDVPNPFAPLLLISHPVESSPPDDPRYQKGYLDLVFLGYYVIFWSFVRQFVTLYACLPLARWYGIKKEAKLDRFGEQGYSLVYWAIMGIWGWVSISHSVERFFNSGCCSESWVNCQRGGTIRKRFGLVTRISISLDLLISFIQDIPTGT
jgi:hypothetical protein